MWRFADGDDVTDAVVGVMVVGQFAAGLDDDVHVRQPSGRLVEVVGQSNAFAGVSELALGELAEFVVGD